MATKKKIQRKPSKSYTKYTTKHEKAEAKRREAAELVGADYEREPQVSMYAYERRNDILRREGFLAWERYWLCQGRIGTPVMQVIRRERKSLYDKVIKGNLVSHNEYASAIAEKYREMGWMFRDGRLSPYKMIDWVAETKGIEDSSPVKRRRVTKRAYKDMAARSRR